ncbi:MAG: uroporphyrinogen-III synthase [Chloroflexota bacterium]
MVLLEAVSPTLHGVRVLLTRSPADNRELKRLLEMHGAEVSELPLLAIAPPDDLAPLDAELHALPTYDWIAFSSRRAVEAVFARLEALGLPPVLPCKIAAVGPSTAAEIEAQGLPVDCMPACSSAADLAVALATHGIAGKRVLAPSGDLTRPELAAGLRAAGAEVRVVTAYRSVRTLEVRGASLDALRRGGVDVVALASPSAINNLASALGAGLPALQYVSLVCIGPTTASAVRELGFEPAAVATEHSVAGLAAAVLQIYETRDQRG